MKNKVDYNRICPICGQQFIAKVHNAVYCSIDCRNTASNRRRHGLKSTEQITKICKHCGKKFIPHVNGWTRNYCFDCIPDQETSITGADMRRYIKKWAIEYKGGKCKICGYNKYNGALEFHHLNSDEKDFIIGDRNLPTSEWPLIQKELDKCILLCSNCHREVHGGVLQIEGVYYE